MYVFVFTQEDYGVKITEPKNLEHTLGTSITNQHNRDAD